MSKKELGLSIKERVLYLRSNYEHTEGEIIRIINSEFFSGTQKDYEKTRSRVRYALGTKYKKKMSQKENRNKGNVNTNSKKEKFVLSAWNQDDGRIMDIDEYCEHYGLPKEDIKDRKLVTHTGVPYWNIHWKNSKLHPLSLIDEELIERVAKKHIKPVKYTIPKGYERFNRVLRAIYTDVHIGMSPNPDGHSLFGGVWNKEEILSRMEEMAEKIVNKAMSEDVRILFVDELGDFMDGWKGKTVRQEHDIPQNMTTEEAFDLGVEFKVRLADILVDSGQFESIVFNNICNDNHAGTFGYVVNSTVKSILDLKYPKLVAVRNMRKFINHYVVGEHAFILSHGKDDKHLKFGFKPIMDSNQAAKIDQYIKENDLYREAKHFEFSKGDSHQMLFDYSTSDDFNYMNYPAFSPSSDWVQTNYKKGRSGFVIQVFSPDDEDIDVFPTTFKWKK